jgi:hypothetical protein
MDGKDNSEDLGVDWTILECILGKWDAKEWIGFIWLRIKISSGLL